MTSNNRKAKKGRWLGIFATTISAIVLGAVMLALIYGATMLGYSEVKISKLEKSEQTWPSVPATIISDELRSATSTEGNVKWFSYWTYSYKVEGKLYMGKSTDIPSGYDTKWFNTKADAVSDGLSRPPGAQINIYYDPDSPNRSVLDKRRTHLVDNLMIIFSVIMLAGAALFGFCIIIIYKVIRNQWKALSS